MMMMMMANIYICRLFITEKDTVRQIAKPDERFEYRVFKDERLNDRRREAVTGINPPLHSNPHHLQEPHN